MNFIRKDNDPNPFPRLRISVRKMQNAIDQQITAVHHYNDTNARLDNQMS